MNSTLHTSRGQKSLITFTTISLISLLLCSSFLALYHSDVAYTSDEVWSVRVAGLDYRSEMTVLKSDVHPPLYFLILHTWIHLFGTGERAVRSLSGLFYLLSVFAVYGVGRRFYGSKIALLCATLYLCSPLAILSAQFARMYGLLSLLSVLSTWLYLQFIVERRNSSVRFVVFVVVNILGTFTHIAFFFLLFGQVFFHLLFYRHHAKRFLLAMAMSVIPYILLWSPVLLNQIGNSRENLAWVKKPSLSMAADLLLVYGGAFWLLVPVLVYIWWRSGSHPFNHFSKLSLKSLPVWLLGTTLAGPFMISLIKPIFNSRLAIVGLPYFALTIGALISKRNEYFLACALVVLTFAFLLVIHPASATCDNRTIAEYLNRTTNDGDVVIFTSLTRLPVDYYLEKSHSTKKLFETSFPAEIDRHPGYEGRHDDPDRRESFELEATNLINKISAMRLSNRDQRIFLLQGVHPEIDSILDRRLRERFQSLSAEGVQCRDTPAYFKEVAVYR